MFFDSFLQSFCFSLISTLSISSSQLDVEEEEEEEKTSGLSAILVKAPRRTNEIDYYIGSSKDLINCTQECCLSLLLSPSNVSASPTRKRHFRSHIQCILILTSVVLMS